MWWFFGAALLYLECFSVGIALINRSLGENRWYLALIPVYGLSYVGKAAGVFKVLAIPVKKFAGFSAECLIIILLCCLYWDWGLHNVVPRGSAMLQQIMLLPVVICYLLIYMGILSATARICKRFNARGLVWIKLASVFLLPIPFILCKIKNGQAMPLNEMFN